MPLGPGVKYRVRTTKSGKRQRIAIRNGKVIEVVNLKKDKSGKLKKSGKVHLLADL